MNTIKQLIEKYCPDGVEYKKLGEVCNINRGVRVVRKDLQLKGEIPVYQNSLMPLGYFNKSNCPKESVYVISAGAAGDIGYSQIPFWAADDCLFFENLQGLLQKFIYYYLCSRYKFIKTQVRRASVPRLSRTVIENMTIPVPPLPVQREIVRILDNFTSLEAKLEAELEAELKARRKQYEYYRDQLLSFKHLSGGGRDEVEWKTLGEIMNISRGASPRPIQRYITDDPNGINWIKIGDVSENAKYIKSTKERITKEGAQRSRLLHKGDFILSNSMSFGRPYILNIDGCIHDVWILMSGFTNLLLPDFLYHILKSRNVQKYWKQKASTGAVSNLNADIVRGTIIPIPSKKQQQDIVSILDRFENLVNDISTGLPAEIAARHQQYEYYRDQLLTFKRKA